MKETTLHNALVVEESYGVVFLLVLRMSANGRLSELHLHQTRQIYKSPLRRKSTGDLQSVHGVEALAAESQYGKFWKIVDGERRTLAEAVAHRLSRSEDDYLQFGQVFDGALVEIGEGTCHHGEFYQFRTVSAYEDARAVNVLFPCILVAAVAAVVEQRDLQKGHIFQHASIDLFKTVSSHVDCLQLLERLEGEFFSHEGIGLAEGERSDGESQEGVG